MGNQTGTRVIKLDTVGSIIDTGARILWIMHYAAADAGEVLIEDSDGGNEMFYFKNVDVSALGNYQFFFLGGQSVPAIYLKTLTASNIVWIGLA